MVWSLRRRRFCSKVGGGALYLAMVEEVVGAGASVDEKK